MKKCKYESLRLLKPALLEPDSRIHTFVMEIRAIMVGNKTFLMLLIVITVIGLSTPPAAAGDLRDKALNAADRASRFMMEEVSTRGGFVWLYSSDLSERWGEIPARDTQIWVQGATNGVGELFLDYFEATGDKRWLSRADRVARAIIWGQHPSGGWHYLIDFDMPGIRTWYAETASRCWGWEEYYHYYGNCTYDNDVTTSSVRFLLRLYMTTLDPAYRPALIKGLDFILASQYPNGSWPQRYPRTDDFVKDGHPDYTSLYTFNDGVMIQNIRVLIEAWEKLGDDRYHAAARRGMDFYLAAQGPMEQPAWAEQYDMDMHPAQARTYEPGAWHSERTALCIRELMEFYRINGDKRYLNAVKPALDWLDSVVVNRDPDKRAERDGRMYPYTHAIYYENGTNRPLYVHRTGTSIENGRYWADYEFGNCPCHVLQVLTINTASLRNEYDRLSKLPADAVRVDYEARTVAGGRKVPITDEIWEIIGKQGERGEWISEFVIPNYSDPCDASGRRTIRGINTRVFLDNMRTLAVYIDSQR